MLKSIFNSFKRFGLGSLLFAIVLSSTVQAQNFRRLIGSTQVFGNRFSELLAQPGNGSTELYLRLGTYGAETGNYWNGTYNSGSTYTTGQRVKLNTNSNLWYIALQNVPTSTPPNAFTNTAYWAREICAEMLQRMPDGNFVRYTLGLNQEDWIRWREIDIVTKAVGSYQVGSGNFTTGTAVGASGSTVTVSAVPQTLSFTVPTGLTNLFDKVSVGSSSSSMNILASGASPNFVNVTLATGQSLASGDFIKLENSSTVFNIARVITYNSGTGAAYIGIINGVGSGTGLTSWTVYKCALVLGTWDSAPTSLYVHGLVDTYNSGTGALQIRTFVQLGASGTPRTTWTFVLGRQAPVITSSQGNQVTQSGGILGVSYLGVYKGSQFTHNCLRRIEGTGFKYIILEGPDAGDEYTVDAYGRPLLMTGSSGTANVTINGTNYLATFVTNLNTTVANWITANATTLAGLNITATQSASTILLSGTGLNTATVSNVTGNLAGSYTGTQDVPIVARDLAHTNETGYAYIAFSITSPNTNSTNTIATADFSTNGSNIPTNNYLVDRDVITVVQNLAGGGDSSGEFAYQFHLASSGSTGYYTPDHNYDRVNFGRSNRVFTVDGVVVDVSALQTNPYSGRFLPITTFSLDQTVEVIHPVDGKVADMTTHHFFDRYGLGWTKPVFSNLLSLTISTGYTNMFRMSDSFFQKMKTGNGLYVSRPEGDTTPIDLDNGEDEQRSYLLYSTKLTTPFKDYAIATDWGTDYKTSWRQGESGKGTFSLVGYSGGPKLYPYMFNSFTIPANYKLGGAMRILVGYWVDANSHN